MPKARKRGLRGRGLGDADDNLISSFISSSGLQPALALTCADPNQWAANTNGCQSLFPGGASDALALTACNIPSSIPGMQAKIADLQANWNPTGNYAPADLQRIVTQVNNMTAQVYGTLQAYRGLVSDSDFLDSAAQGFVTLAQQAANYSVGWAPGQTAMVAAPGLKEWVIAAMTGMLNAMQAMALSACTQSGWGDALNTFEGLLDDVWSAAKAVGGVVLAAGQAVVNVAEQAVGIVAFLIKYAPYLIGGAILVGGGLYFYRWNQTSRRFPSLLPKSAAAGVHGW